MAGQTFATNRRAKFDYTLQTEFVAGLVLFGHEAKSIRSGGASLKGAYVTISRDNEAWLTNAHINKYQHATTIHDYDPERPRKLLLSKKELKQLIEARNNKQTIIPISLFKAGKTIKLKIAIAIGKKQYDKRQTIKRRDIERHEDRKFK